MVTLAGDFSSAFNRYKIRTNGSWEENPLLNGKVCPSSYTEVGTYQLEYPNPNGALDDYVSIGDVQEIFASDPSDDSMHKLMTGIVNNIEKKNNHRLKVTGRDLTGILLDRQVVDSWQDKKLDFIICDETFGIIQTLFSERNITTFNAFSLDYDDFGDWNATRWGSQPAYATIDSSILKFSGDSGEDRTITGEDTYNYKHITFKARVTSLADNVYFGLTDGTDYIRFKLPASGTIACENYDGTQQTNNVSGTYTITDYNYYRIEWEDDKIRFFVNGTEEHEETSNIPTGNLSPYFQIDTATTNLWVDYVKVVDENETLERYKVNNKNAYETVEDLCAIAGTNDIYVFYIDNNYDLNARERQTTSSGLDYGKNSSTYSNNVISSNFVSKGDEVKNVINVYGGEKLTTVSAPDWTDQFIGDGTQTTWALGFKANKPLTLVEINSVQKTEDTDFTVIYGNYSTTFKTTVAPSNTHTVNLRYDYFTRVLGYAEDDTSINNYEIKELNYYDENIESDEVANLVADGLLRLKSDPRASGDINIIIKPQLTVGNTINLDDPNNGINTQEYEIMKIEHDIIRLNSKLTLITSEITTVPETFKAIWKELKDIRSRLTDSDVPSLKSYKLSETIDFGNDLNNTTGQSIWICDSRIYNHPTNSDYWSGTILDDFEGTPSGSWSGTFTVGASTTYKQVGSKSMSLIYSGTGSKSITSTSTFGDISTYTGANSGSPTTGCSGIWLYQSASSQVNSLSLKLGSGASDYNQIPGKLYGTDKAGTENQNITGWNYYIFPMTSGTITGTPDWTAADYAQLEINVASGSTLYADYFTIGSNTNVALCGFGRRVMEGSEVSL